MEPAKQRRLDEILRTASDLPAEEQDAYLGKACLGEAGLLEEARRRLKIANQATVVVDLSSALEEAERQHAKQDLPGTAIGSIRIRELLGEGGMGEVYLGYDEKLKRGVAVKSIRPEHGLSPEIKARFLREAQILSSLDHPNICQIYDYVQEDDRDFLVLELIEGRCLDQVVDETVTEADRMRIALQIADVLVAAHTQGVIHRDLKPTNVMVTPEGEIKVLDFGIARSVTEEEIRESQSGVELSSAVNGDTPLQPFVTQPGSLVGTLHYMSPEQARGERSTPASDMFAYGVMIQEIFSGRPICDPVRGRALIDVIEGRTPPVRGLGGDLTALIERLKSVAPGARPSAADTAEQLRRIQSAPLRRRRRRLRIAAVAALTLVTLVMSVLSFVAYQQSRLARREAESTRQALSFLVKLFEVSDPTERRGETITAREILDKGASRIVRELRDEPVIRARLLDSIGVIYQKIGLRKAAEPLLTEALETRRASLGNDHPQVAETLYHLADLYIEQRRLDEAVEVNQQALAIFERSYGPRHAQVIKTIEQSGVVTAQQGKFEEAETLMLRARALREGQDDDNPRDTALGLSRLALLYEEQGRFDEAEEIHREALAILEELGTDHDLAHALNGLAILYDRQRRHEEALPLYERALATLEKLHEPEHPDIASILTNLASLHANSGELDRAEQLYRKSLAIYEKAYGGEHPRIAELTGNFGLLAIKQNKFLEAEAFLRRAMEIFEKDLGPQHPAVGLCKGGIGVAFLSLRRYEDAELHFRDALTLFEKALGPESPEVGQTLDQLASVYAKTGRLEEAVPMAERAVTIAEGVFGPEHEVTALRRATHADVERRRGNLASAEAVLLSSRTALEAALGEDDPKLFKVLLGLANVYRDQGDFRRAEPIYDRAAAVLRGEFGDEHPSYVALWEDHAQMLRAAGRGSQARALETRAQAQAEKFGLAPRE